MGKRRVQRRKEGQRIRSEKTGKKGMERKWKRDGTGELFREWERKEKVDLRTWDSDDAGSEVARCEGVIIW